MGHGLKRTPSSWAVGPTRDAERSEFGDTFRTIRFFLEVETHSTRKQASTALLQNQPKSYARTLKHPRLDYCSIVCFEGEMEIAAPSRFPVDQVPCALPLRSPRSAHCDTDRTEYTNTPKRATQLCKTTPLPSRGTEKAAYDRHWPGRQARAGRAFRKRGIQARETLSFARPA